MGCHNRGLSVLTGDDVFVDLLFIYAPIVCVVLCPSVYIQAPQRLRLLSGLTGDSAVVVDLLFIVAPIVLCCFMPVSIYLSPSVASAAVCSYKR